MVVASLFLALPSASWAQAAPLSLADIIRKAQARGRTGMARSETEAADARLDEARAAAYPRLKATGFLTASPEIDCLDVTCSRTDPEQFALRFSGVFLGGALELTQPLFTFGKLSAAARAARAGVTAQRALEDAAAGDVAVDAARAYWGFKLARDLGYMLDDGIEEIAKALTRLDQRLDQGDGGVTLADRLRIETLLAEGKVQRAEARRGQEQALAAIRALVGDDAATVDDTEIEATTYELGDASTRASRSVVDRPEVKAATAGATAARELAELESAHHWPDLAVMGSVSKSHAQGVDDPPSAFASDPFNSTTAAMALVMRWQIEPWTTSARTARARAQARKASQLQELALDGARFEVRSSHAEAAGAREAIEAARAGEKSARGWLASVLQGEAVGTTEAKDLADAYIAWFQMRARLLNAYFQWNVAVMRVERATGSLHAPR
jgi:outer membrane protein TolC